MTLGGFLYTFTSNTFTITNNIDRIGVAIVQYTNLETIDFSNNGILTIIDDNAFRGCNLSGHVVIPDSVNQIGQLAFAVIGYFFTNTSFSITLPNGLTEIPRYCFNNSTLTSINIPNSVQTIGDIAFAFCQQLASITLPNQLTEIPYACFYSSGLTTIDIPNSVQTIGSSLFAYCGQLASITLPNQLTKLSVGLLYDTAITTLRIPSSVTLIDEHAFSQYMETIIFPEHFNFSNLTIHSPQLLSGTVQFKVEVDSVNTYQTNYQNTQLTISYDSNQNGSIDPEEETTYQLGYIIKQNQVCLLKDTLIQTDQGLVKVQELSKHNTIGGQHILGYSCGYYLGKQIIKIEKDLHLVYIFLIKIYL